MDHGLTQFTIDRIREILGRYPQVQKAILFGDRARGDYGDKTDIELALEGDDIDISLLFMIDNDLVDLLLPYEVDLIRLSRVKNTELKEHIEEEGVSLFEK
ncbi:nucleotidyltransferase domain-containing protein [Salibacter halophilus]|uniref:Nucleotidyltransferase domain-containing protein n=1 Tax=Salibacter halophilus TaxID=1803916 RepID=A0A6N6M1L2_9FLAO|nr:nucleotidyltransferase domain-containing protein [Salibacter halophilus]KAB1062022.1 nucleotidyltransferase domain-containing protein [Salibacter halophilus]